MPKPGTEDEIIDYLLSLEKIDTTQSTLIVRAIARWACEQVSDDFSPEQKQIWQSAKPEGIHASQISGPDRALAQLLTDSLNRESNQDEQNRLDLLCFFVAPLPNVDVLLWEYLILAAIELGVEPEKLAAVVRMEVARVLGGNDYISDMSEVKASVQPRHLTATPR